MSQKLQNFAKFQKFQLDNLVDFEKCCETHILNYYFLAKIGPDTAENEQHFAEFCQKLATTLRVVDEDPRDLRLDAPGLHPLRDHGPDLLRQDRDLGDL